MGNFLSDAWEGVKSFFKGPKVADVPMRSTAGFDPEFMKLAEDQITRGYARRLFDDRNKIADFYAGKGFLNSSAAVEAMNKAGVEYFDRYMEGMTDLNLKNLMQRQDNANYNADAQYQNSVNKRQRWQSTWETVGKVAGLFA